MTARLNLPPQPHIGFGQVHHARIRPVRNQFTYGNYFLMLPMRTLQTQAAQGAPAGWMPNRAGLISFHDRDHGDGRAPAQGGALAWLDELLHSQGIADANGEVWLQTYPRVLGYAFKPVSFWYCHRSPEAGGGLRAIVAEVNNTFGERHCYVLDAPQWGQTVQADKVFHVSPFCEVKGHYEFCFSVTRRDGHDHISARVDHHAGADGLLLHTRIGGTLQPLNRTTLHHALLGYPLMTLAVVWRIHSQALRLWRLRVPFFRKPERVGPVVTRSTPQHERT
ncbi:MAG: DUF1365 domain-containing protein [Rhodoferax sp.]